MAEDSSNIELAAEVAAAYVSNNSVRPADLAALIGDIHAALARLSTGAAVVAAPAKQNPAVAIKKSVSDDFIICLEDGRKFKSLKRHLRTSYNLSPEQYREKWGLPHDYPMVAPAYSKARSALAHSIGLGQKRQGRKKVGAKAAK
jgi:predicted transcriptional regulator